MLCCQEANNIQSPDVECPDLGSLQLLGSLKLFVLMIQRS